MRVLVTGATGFLGRALVSRASDAGFDVTAHGRVNASPFEATVPYVCGDLAIDSEAATVLRPWRWDAVVNLAGPVTGGTEEWTTGTTVAREHVRIALNVRGFAHPDTRIVHASSMTVYGDPERSPVREDHPRRPRHLYGLAKLLAEDVLLSAPRIDAWVLRFPGLFAEYRRAGALFHFCRSARTGQPIRVTATTPTPWDVLDVDDACTAIIAALRSHEDAGGAMNVSYGDPVELVAVASWIAAHAGAGSVVENVGGVNHPTMQMDIEVARRKIEWAPASLRDRLARLFNAYAQGPE